MKIEQGGIKGLIAGLAIVLAALGIALVIQMRELKEYDKLNKNLRGIREMKKLPDALVIVDPRKEENAIKEADKQRVLDAIKTLSVEQQWLVKQVYVYGRKKVEIAAELGIDNSSVRDRFRVIFKKIKGVSPLKYKQERRSSLANAFLFTFIVKVVCKFILKLN